MMIKGQREQNGHCQKNIQHQLIPATDDEHVQDVDRHNHEFRRDHIGHDSPDKESVLALKQGVARRAMMFDMKWSVHD